VSLAAGLLEDLEPAHREVRALAREFAEGEIAPHAAEWNERHHVPLDVLREMGELGLLGVIVPEELGGAGLDYTSLCLVVEELARADAGVSVAVAVQNGLVASPLLRSGTPEQQERWLPGLASGRLMGAYALTEPDAGSDTASLRTEAVPAPDGSFVVRGSKQWITNGGFADLYVLFARTDGPGARGVSAFVVERGPGLAVGREIPKMGLHTSSTVELAFDGLRAGPDRLLGARGEGLRIALATLDGGRITIAAQALGIAAAALELAVRHARERTAFGGPIARFQGVQFPLADVAAKLEAARLLTYRAARLRDAGRPHGVTGARAKLLASAVAVEAADVAVQTLGGYGYSTEFPAERYYRDAKITELYEGTSEIQRVVIARDLLGDAARGDGRGPARGRSADRA
jgi:alkylation response protein AidB-like acyl-CoA dehydrogenase